MPAPSVLVLAAIRLFLAAEALIGAARSNWLALFVAGSALALTFLPQLIASRVKLRLPMSFLAAIALFVLGSIYLGELRDFYTRFWWWDLVLHATSAMGFGVLGFLFIFMLFQGDRYAAPAWAIGLLTFSTAMTVGALWEIFEFAMDQLFGFNMQKSGLLDTMGDLIVDMLGAALAGLAGAAFVAGRFNAFAQTFEAFIAANRPRFRKLTRRKPRR
jgi:hypothetical protein